ncbi:MAG: TIGR04222 domain-containing membrane protein [Bryobacterales bacterium]|nr:TIGR04222 domain-containing membrane protein [Bryobacterales bacterium]
MNPFDLRGPEFLLFYFVLSVVAVVAVRHLVRQAEPEAGEPVRLTDPYLIAYLRGGVTEAVNVAVISLLDRNLIVAEGTTLVAARDRSAAGVTHDLEKSILKALPIAITKLLSELRGSLNGYQAHLLRHGLIASDGLKVYRRNVYLAAVTLLAATAFLKISIGISRGRPVLFLVILAVATAIALTIAAFPKTTRRAKATLDECRHLFSGLRDASANWQPGSATPDLVMMAAVFGAATIPMAAAPYRRELFGQPTSSGTDSGSSSSCGSSSDSGGSSCGGGGGGCGGCGGGGE